MVKRFHKKVTAMVTREVYEAIKMIIKSRRERFRQSNPPMMEWNDRKWAKAFESCTVAGCIRDGLVLLIKKELESNADAVLSTSKY